MTDLYTYEGDKLDLTDNTLTLPETPADAESTGEKVRFLEKHSLYFPELYITGTTPTSKDQGKLKVKVDYYSQELSFSEYATLKVQGNTSVGFPKKNFNIAFFSDADCTQKSKHNFGWGKQNKYTLKANWIDITQARNVVTARLWTDVVRSRSDFSSLPAGLREAPNLAVIDGFIIKVYVNGVYQGRYTFNLPKDAWMFNMDDELESNVALYSENFDSGCYRSPAVVDGTDWTDEIHEDAVPQSVVTRLNALITFLNSATDQEVLSNLSNYIDIQSFIDYYIFGLVDCGHDSFGKNQVLLSYDNCPYIASVYDMDCSWGLKWNGRTIYAIDCPFSDYGGASSNVLYTRLTDLFDTQIRSRYTELRAGTLSAPNIIHRFEEFLANVTQELIEEDYATTTANGSYVNIPSMNLTSLAQIRNYAAGRLGYVDSFILS